MDFDKNFEEFKKIASENSSLPKMSFVIDGEFQTLGRDETFDMLKSKDNNTMFEFIKYMVETYESTQIFISFMYSTVNPGTEKLNETNTLRLIHAEKPGEIIKIEAGVLMNDKSEIIGYSEFKPSKNFNQHFFKENLLLDTTKGE